MKKIKLFLSDIDGTLTDGCVYYSESGEELKKFSHRDGRGFHLLHEIGIECGLITSETGGINRARFDKFKKLGTVNFFSDSSYGEGKVEKIKHIQKILNISNDEICYIGDDTNDLEALKYCKYKACPADSNYLVKKIEGIYICKNNGGNGSVREYIDYIIESGLV